MDKEQINTEKKSSETVSVNSRRKFIQKASAGAALTTLSAKSVWGACTVSGALSTGSNADNHCRDYPLTGGRSPGFWQEPNSNNNQACSAFTHVGCDNIKVNCHIKKTKATVKIPLDAGDWAAELSIDAVLGASPEYTVDLNVIFGLDSQGNNNLYGKDENVAYHLAAAYMNAFYGFYDGALAGTEFADVRGNEQRSKEFVQDLYALFYAMSYNSQDYLQSWKTMMENSYTDGTTDYVPSYTGIYTDCASS